MILTITTDITKDEKVFTLRVTGMELVRAELHAFDRMLIRDCENSDKVSDKLLALETIARRIEESLSGDEGLPK